MKNELSRTTDQIQPAKVVDGVLVYSFPKCLAWLQMYGQKNLSKHFKIYKEDREVILKLLLWAIQDEKNAPQYGVDLKKGILLAGPIGCGKTTLMHLTRFFTPQRNKYLVKSTREIANEYVEEGTPVINRYSGNRPGKTPLSHSYCFDDLGVEKSASYYGNRTNVMGEIILSSYDRFKTNNRLNHITTNLSAKEIEQLYGNRVRSRMREMYNLIPFPNNSKDKRK
jgi:DNA polymerase III delta prime subunit